MDKQNRNRFITPKFTSTEYVRMPFYYRIDDFTVTKNKRTGE